MLKIGITCGFLYPDKTRGTYEPKTLSFVENETVNYAARSGALPIIIPDLDPEMIPPFLDQLDAVILHGGADVAPESYGEKPIGNWPGDKHRDEYELRIIDYAYKKGIPVLGICRGCQILNVYFGGTLYQDIPTQVKNHTVHSDREKFDLNFHQVEFTKDTVLNDLYSASGCRRVNSIHHQAVKDLGKDLIPLAYSPGDGIIEAFMHKDTDKLYLGIQWHPEFNHNAGIELLDADILMRYFLSSIK